MNVTKNEIKDRQLHIEDYLQMVSAEQKEYAEVSAHSRITENNDIITEFQTDKLLEQILQSDNLNKAYKKVKSNKGAGGVDGMSVDELLTFLKDNQKKLIQKLKDGKYKPNPVRRVEIPKETKGKIRKLGIPTVVDRVFQQAITQVLSPIYEEQKCRMRIHSKSIAKMKAKLKELTSRSNGWGNEYRALKLKQFIRGWVNYFAMADMKQLLRSTDEWLRRKIRAIYWKQWKKIKTRYRMIKKFGMPEWKVHELANCRKGIWRSAIMLNSVLTNKVIVSPSYSIFLLFIILFGAYNCSYQLVKPI
jgi:hypothetical protein